MEDLIPFLIVIAISIVGSLSRKKKKRRFGENITQDPQPQRQQDDRDDIFSWLEKVTGEEEEQPIPYSETAEAQEAIDSEPGPQPGGIAGEPVREKEDEYKYEKYSGILTQEEKDVIMNKSNSNNFDDIKTSEDDLTNSENDLNLTSQRKKSKIDFDLRKAVIYSEILNRKYT